MAAEHPTASQALASCLLAALVAPAGCIYLPQSTSVYDRECQANVRQMQLSVTQIGGFARCSNDDCVALLAAAGALSAASLVVSGSIVVTGNMVTWFERQARCVHPGAAPPQTGPAGALNANAK